MNKFHYISESMIINERRNMINYDEFYPATFISTKQYCGFQTNQHYTLKVNENKPYGVMITVLGDNDFEMKCPYCNLKSVERVWKIEV